MGRRIGFVSYGLAVQLSLLPTLEALQRSPYGYRGGELLPEADFHRPDCATRRRTSAGIPAGVFPPLRTRRQGCRRSQFPRAKLQACPLGSYGYG